LISCLFLDLPGNKEKRALRRLALTAATAFAIPRAFQFASACLAATIGVKSHRLPGGQMATYEIAANLSTAWVCMTRRYKAGYSSKAFAKIFHPQHPLQFLDGQRLKIKMFIELPCLFVDRRNENCTCADDVRCLGDSPKCIFEKRLP
jgi:hypothetical protein